MKNIGVTFLASILSSLTLLACSAATPGDVTLPSLAGLPTSAFAAVQRCEVVSGGGSTLGTYVATRYMTLATDGTYNYYIIFSDATTCTGRAGVGVSGAGQTAASGASDIFDYSQTGTFSPVANSDGTFTLTMHPTAESFTTRSNSAGTAMAADVNANCLLTLTVPSTTSLASNVSCNGGGVTSHQAYLIPSPTSLNATITQTLSIAGRGYNLGTFSSILTPGALGSTAPSTVATGFYTY